jgi:hypothetical protein
MKDEIKCSFMAMIKLMMPSSGVCIISRDLPELKAEIDQLLVGF